jgi:hypothetical protein
MSIESLQDSQVLSGRQDRARITGKEINLTQTHGPRRKERIERLRHATWGLLYVIAGLKHSGRESNETLTPLSTNF